MIKVPNNEKLLPNLPLYMEGGIVHFVNIRKEKNTYCPEMHLDKTAVNK